MAEAPDALLDLEDACDEVFAVWAGGLLRPSTDPEGDVRAMSDDGVVRATEALARLARHVQSLQARVAVGVAERSQGGEDGADLARSHGFSTAERLIAQATGGRYAEAARLVAVGEATAKRLAFSGGEVPAKRPCIAAALQQGELCIDAADAIRRFLDRVELRAGADGLASAEALLVDRAPEVGVDGLARLIKQLEAHLDPDGVKPREDELRARRSLSIWEDAAGMIVLRGALDPVNGAPLKLAIETLVGAELHRARDARRPFGRTPGVDAHGGDDAVVESRTIAQMNADALADIARLSLASSDAPPSLRSVTVVARVGLDDLVAGTGLASLDGIELPVSIQTIRELIASSGIAPILIGRTGEVLQLGRSARLFSPAQKLAIAERDGGCAFPGCRRPPSHTQVHHINWWSRDEGRTDLDNGILLCSHHHHLVHDDGWTIRIRDHRSWFIPPLHIDPARRPRAGNLALHRLAPLRRRTSRGTAAPAPSGE